MSIPTKVMEYVQHFARDMRSIRAVWVWIILTIFCWGFIYLVKHGDPDVVKVVYTVFGGVASVVVTNYVLSKGFDKMIGHQSKPEAEETGGESD